MADEREGVVRGKWEARDAFLRRVGEKYPWLHPDYDPSSPLWRERMVRAWNAMGRQPRLY